MLPLSLPEGAEKMQSDQVTVLSIKLNFSLRKSATNFLCVNCQR